jgi:hypothetical protein
MCFVDFWLSESADKRARTIPPELLSPEDRRMGYLSDPLSLAHFKAGRTTRTCLGIFC